jgi:2,5-diketo-D-gluconate reductase A
MSISSSAIPQIELNAGVRIPQIGFGVFQVPATDTAEAALRARPGRR